MKKKLLFVDACIRDGESSRSRALCNIFLAQVRRFHPEYEVETLVLKDEGLRPLLQADMELRDSLIEAGETGHESLAYARQFVSADRILVGAPYWDLSFPSLLRVYIEHIFVNGMAFRYDENGTAEGLCRAEKLMYIQTAGGFLQDGEPGEVYLRAVCEMLGIGEFQHIWADGMDILEIDRRRQWEIAVKKAAEAARNW